MPAGEGDKILRTVEVVLPQPVVLQLGTGIAGEHPAQLLLGYLVEHRTDALLPTIVLNGGDGLLNAAGGV